MLQNNTEPGPLVYSLGGQDFQPAMLQDNIEPDPVMCSLDGVDFQPAMLQDNTEDGESQRWSQSTEETCVNVGLPLLDDPLPLSEGGNADSVMDCADWADSQSYHSDDSGCKTTQSEKAMRLKDEDLNLHRTTLVASTN
jgi:hypothetical protein